MVSGGPPPPAPPAKQPYPAEKARGGEIILDTHFKRGVFAAGLIGAAIPGLLLSVWR
jgi:hypothetical protein